MVQQNEMSARALTMEEIIEEYQFVGRIVFYPPTTKRPGIKLQNAFLLFSTRYMIPFPSPSESPSQSTQ